MIMTRSPIPADIDRGAEDSVLHLIKCIEREASAVFSWKPSTVAAGSFLYIRDLARKAISQIEDAGLDGKRCYDLAISEIRKSRLLSGQLPPVNEAECDFIAAHLAPEGRNG